MPWLYSAAGGTQGSLPRRARKRLCTEQQTGYSVNGGLAEYVLADPDYVGRLPSNVDFAEIAPSCVPASPVQGLKVTDAEPGDWVVISGIGGLGHMAIAVAKAMGLNRRCRRRRRRQARCLAGQLGARR